MCRLLHRKDNVMKKAIKAIVGIALALSFAVIPSAINSGDASSSSSSIATVSASGFVVVANPNYYPPYAHYGRMYACPYKVYYQGSFYDYSYTPYIG